MATDDPQFRGARRRRWIEIAALGFVVATLAMTLRVAIANPLREGDAVHLVAGAWHSVDCVEHGVFSNCQTWNGGTAADEAETHVGPWPLMQYIPAAVMRWAGVSGEATLDTLIVIDALALGVLVGVAWITLRRLAAPVWAPTLAAALVTGPLLWYGTSAFGEALGATLVLGAVAAFLLHVRPVFIVPLVAAACITKETNPAFVAGLLALCLLIEPMTSTVARDDMPWTRRVIAPVIGVVIGLAANTAFNLFRFGSVRNTIYLDPLLQVQSTRIAARSFLAQWFAPNGGMLWFWPSALAILLLVGIGSLRELRHPPRRWAAVVPLGIAGLLVANVVGLSRWYSPFGWLAWGPRLTYTVVPAMLLLACVAAPPTAALMLRRILTGVVFWLIVGITVAAAVPQAAVVYEPHVIGEFFFDPNPNCPSYGHIEDRPTYYHCFFWTAWHRQPWLLERGMDGLDTNGGKVITVTMTGAAISLLLVARGRARRDRPTDESAVIGGHPGTSARDVSDPDVGARERGLHDPQWSGTDRPHDRSAV